MSIHCVAYRAWVPNVYLLTVEKSPQDKQDESKWLLGV